MQLHILPNSEFLIEIHMLRNNANPLLDSARVATEIMSADADRSARRLRLHREHTDDGRLACTIRTEKPEDLTVPNGEADPRHRRFPCLLLRRIRMRKCLDEILHLDHH